MAEPMQIQQTENGGEDQSQDAARTNIQGIPNFLTEKRLKKLAGDLGTKGQDFGIELGINTSTIKVFGKNNPNDQVGANFDMLVEYVDDNAGTDLVSKFLQALKDIGRNNLALELQAEAEAAGDLR